MAVNESQIQRCCDSFLYDLEEEFLFYKLTDLNENHRRCVLQRAVINMNVTNVMCMLLLVLVTSFSVGLFLYHAGSAFGFCLPFT